MPRALASVQVTVEQRKTILEALLKDDGLNNVEVRVRVRGESDFHTTMTNTHITHSHWVAVG